MGRTADATEVARALRVGIGMFVRRLRQVQEAGELTMPQVSALNHLDRAGPATPTALARLEQITPQSMGATLALLEERGLLARTPHAEDGRQVVLSLTARGSEALRSRSAARTERLARALARNFTAEELDQLRRAAPLIERLAQSI